MAYDHVLANRIRELLAGTHHQVEEKNMFGGLCFMVNGKMCVGVQGERLMVRFDPVNNDEVMEKNGVGPMDFTKRILKGYAFVGGEVLAVDKNLEFWLAQALEFNKKAKSSVKKKH